MKKIKFILLIALLSSISIFHSAYASDEIKVFLNGEQLLFTQPPVIVENRTLVPMRAIFEALGAEVTWDADSRTATGSKKGIEVKLTIDDSTMTRNNVFVPIDVPAKIINNSTMIPLRVISECFGMDVQWDANSHVITITDLHTIGKLDWNDTYYYYGEIKDGKGIGYGELYSIETDEIVQSGYFDGSRMTEGLNNSSNGDISIGTYSDDGLLTGFGLYIWADGDYYMGDWVDDKKNGYGSYFYSNGDQYEGNWVDSKKNGYGVYTWSDGAQYEGDWVDGEQNGYGVYTWSDGTRKYEGNWVDGKKSGLGTHYDFSAQLSYEGNHIDGNLDGIFVVRNMSDNTISHYVLYSNGEYVKLSYNAAELENYLNTQSRSEQYLKQYDELNAAYAELGEWYESEMDSLLEDIYDGSIPTYKIETQKQIIEDTYTQQKQLLDNQRESLLAKINELEKKSNNSSSTSQSIIQSSDIKENPLDYVELYTLPLHIYSYDRKTYLGKVITDEYDQDSIMNQYGKYGSEYRSTSIWNQYGKYGSEYRNQSAFNDKASEPPVVVDNNGLFVGYLTTNDSFDYGITPYELLSFMEKYDQ